MRFRSKTVLTGAIVAVLALGLSVPALAAEDETPVSKAWGGVCQGTSAMATALSELLDMSTDEIAAQRQDGKSLEDIAATKDVTKEDLVGTVLESRMAVLDQAVQDGRITQDQADLMLSNMQTRMSERVSDPAVGPRGGGNANGGGCGMGAGMGAGQGRGAGAGLGPRSGAAATQL